MKIVCCRGRFISLHIRRFIVNHQPQKGKTKTMTKKIVFIFSLFFYSCLQAQDSLRVSSLEEVVFTSNKYPRKQTETGKVLTIIGREQLEKSYGRTLGEVLNTVVGVTSVGSNSNLGTNQTISMRGGSAGNVLILLNGVPVNDPSVNDNYIDLNFFAIEQIERVEILKGGQSTLYGSDAVAGVINIITKKPGAKGTHTDLSAAAGTYGTLKTNIGLSHSGKKSRLSLQYGYNRSDGFSSAHDSTGKADYEKDGFNQHNITGNWQLNISERLQANVFGLYSRYKTGIDGSAFNDEQDYNVTTDNLHAGAGLTYTIGDGNIHLNYRYNKVNRLYLDDSAFSAPNYLRDEYAGGTHFAELYGNKKWRNNELLAGIDYRHNKMEEDLLSISSFGPYTTKFGDSLSNMSQISPYASVVFKAGEIFNMEVGGRLNSHSEYGTNFSYTVNPSVFLNNKVKVFLNLYSAFKAPTLFELFHPLFGNRMLDPETSFNVEGGAQWFITDKLNARAVYYHRNTKDAIEFIYTDPVNYFSQYTNISNKKANGLELELEYRGDKWNVAANYAYTKGRLTSPYDNTGFPLGKDSMINDLYRVPKNAFNMTGGYWWTKKLYTGTTLRIAGDRLEPIYASSPVVLDNYYTWDVYGEYRFSKQLKVFADFKNITNQEYFEILGYNTRKFNVMAGVQVSL